MKSTRRADKSKKTVIGRGLKKRSGRERRIEEELSRSSGGSRHAEENKEEEEWQDKRM